MGLRNASWYNLNETRAYPLDDAATGLGDGGEPLPYALLADLSLRYPRSLGAYPFVSAAAVTPGLVAVTFQASATPDGADFVPLGAVSVPLASLRRYALYPVRAQSPGVAGWLAFGGGAAGPGFAARFSTPRQSLLCPRAAWAYPDPPVPSLGRLGAPGLSGVVTLSGQAPVRVEAGFRQLGGELRRAVVFSLADDPGTAPSAGSLARLAGPCGGRPESGTCGDPAPVETVNGVPPDCDGEVTLELAGCAAGTPQADFHGLVLDCGLGLSAACPPDRLPGAGGLLPGETAGYESYAPPPDPAPWGCTPDAGLPALTCWATGLEGFVPALGAWAVLPGGDPGAPCGGAYALACEGPSSPTRRNVALWGTAATGSVCREAACSVLLSEVVEGAAHNGGLVLNYSGDVYVTAELDFDTQSLALRRCADGGYTSFGEVTLPRVALGEWYTLTAAVVPGPFAGSAGVTVRAVSSSGAPAVDVSMGPVLVPSYGAAAGRFGVQAVRSSARFGFFSLREV